MKYLSILAILILSFNPSYAQDYLTITDDRIEVSIDSNANAADLEDIKVQLSQVDITLEYPILEFNKDGRLKEISFTVDCNDGYKGSASKEFSFINRGLIGFYRDYNNFFKNAFGTFSKPN